MLAGSRALSERALTRFAASAGALFWATVPLAWLTACGGSGAEDRQTATTPSAYAKSGLCAECHEAEAAAWSDSHHALAMQTASASSVLGDFDQTSFEDQGITTSFFRRGGGFWVNTEGPDGELHDYEISYTFGVEPLQQYLIEFEGGRLQCLTIAWDSDDQRWFSLYPGERFAPDDALHWTGRYQNWNMMCADCHSTHLFKNYDAGSDTYDTRWEALNVSCQACHGPGSQHIARAREAGEDWQPDADESGFALHLARGAATAQIEACAPCHSRRQTLSAAAHRPGSFHDDYAIESLRAPLYYADGQMHEEVYVVGSFLQSKMHQKGVSCSDCHDPHSLNLWVEGDAVCLQCHSQAAPIERFPSLTAAIYDAPEHHHHPQDSLGARCKSCHMPEHTYMQIDERYDHSLRIPRPDMTALLGTPNACNGCHTEESADWAAAAILEWTGAEPKPHRGVVFAAARGAHPAVTAPLAGLAHDPEQPAIVRASAMDLLSGYPQGGQVKLMALSDDEPLVRAAALNNLTDIPEALLAERVAPLCSDPVRRVRIAAARALAGVGDELLGGALPACNSARAELMASFDANLDLPATNLSLALYLADCGDPKGASRAYLRALELDQDFLPAVFNLASLLTSLERRDEARSLLITALERHPVHGELHYSLGLLLAEMDDFKGALEALQSAAREMPFRARVHYNAGLAAQQLGRVPAAEAALKRAAELDPEAPDFAYALATFYLAQMRYDRALEWAKKLASLVPEAPGPHQLIEEIKRQRKSH
jgi:tetratricopeptide (TPR) repeat protein